MNVESAVITIDPEEAREKLRAYRTNLHKDVEAEYAALAKAYEHVGTHPLIDINHAIQSGGFDDRMRPRIAIAAAHRKVVRFEWPTNGTVAWFDANHPRRRQFEKLRTRVDLRRTPGTGRWVSGFAMVPLVPADVRPKHGQLRQWHVLWEVDKWFDRHPTEPPRDPYLLKHVHGSLYAVLAQWDLTELERSVMRELRTESR